MRSANVEIGNEWYTKKIKTFKEGMMITALTFFLWYKVEINEFDKLGDKTKSFYGFLFITSLIIAFSQDIALSNYLWN